jgi:hypothetical protein
MPNATAAFVFVAEDAEALLVLLPPPVEDALDDGAAEDCEPPGPVCGTLLALREPHTTE